MKDEHRQIMDEFLRKQDEIRARLVWSLVDQDEDRHRNACMILGVDPKLDFVKETVIPSVSSPCPECDPVYGVIENTPHGPAFAECPVCKKVKQ